MAKKGWVTVTAPTVLPFDNIVKVEKIFYKEDDDPVVRVWVDPAYIDYVFPEDECTDGFIKEVEGIIKKRKFEIIDGGKDEGKSI